MESTTNVTQKPKAKRKSQKTKTVRLNRRHTIANKANISEYRDSYTSDDKEHEDDIVEEAGDEVLFEDLNSELVEMEKELLIASIKISSQDEEMNDLNKQCDINKNEIDILTNNNNY